MVKRLGIRMPDAAYARLCAAFTDNQLPTNEVIAVDPENPTQEEIDAHVQLQIRKWLQGVVHSYEREAARRAIPKPADMSIQDDVV